MMPPVRAALDGVTGAMMKSAKAAAYPRPKVERPKMRIIQKEMRLPRLVSRKAWAMI